MLHLTADIFYRMWAVVGPLVGVGLGAWLTARWQRKKWILDNKVAEYRSILDALNSYRRKLATFNALYGPGSDGVLIKERHEAQMDMFQALDAVNNAFADRIFIRQTVEKSGARNDWDKFNGMLSSKPVHELLKQLESLHDELLKASLDDLNLVGGPPARSNNV
jgi:hypothetical protein